MPVARVQLPDGRIGRFEVPEGASPEQIEAFVTQMTTGQQDSFGESLAYSVGGGFNRGLAKGLGAPVDVTTAILNLLPGVDIQNPVGGSRSIENLLNGMGIAPAPDEELPHPFVGRVAEEVGGAAVPFGIVGGIARTGATGGHYGKPILDAFREAPRLNAAGEASAAVGAGVGAAVAQEVAPDNATAELIGQLLGGFAHPVAIASDSARVGTGTVKRVFGPYLPGGARRSAARALRDVVEDPEAARQTLSRPSEAVPGAELTPAQETGDRGLLALERALGRSRSDIGDYLDEANRKTRGAVRAEAADLGGAYHGEPREYLADRLRQIRESMDTRIEQAQRRARVTLQDFDPQVPREELSRRVRDQIEAALQAERGRESALWAMVPDDVPTSTVGLKQAYRDLRGGMRKAEADDFPEFLDEFLGDGARLADSEPLGEVQAFRSKLLREIRRERALDAPSRRKIAILEQMQEAALRDMQVSDAGESLQDAIAFSRVLNERFTQGPIGRILGYERRGGSRVAPEQTLDRLLARDGVEGMINYDALLKAADTPEMRATAEDYLRHRFVLQATDPDGKVQSAAAKRFLRNNEALLERMPDVRQQLEGAVSVQDLADRTQTRLLARQRGLMDRRKSRAALYLDAPVGREVRTVLNSKDPDSALRELVRQVGGDLTGTARKGLKAQFIDEMLAQSERSGRISGQDLDDFLKRHRKLMTDSGLFGKEEMMRIDRMRITLNRIEKGTASGRRIDELLDETPDAITDLVARIAGANIGARGAAGSTGAPLVAAHAGSKFVRRLTNKIPFEKTRDVLAEAILDRNVMKDLLERVPTGPKAQEMTRRMNAWLVNLAPETEEEERDPLRIEINRGAGDF